MLNLTNFSILPKRLKLFAHETWVSIFSVVCYLKINCALPLLISTFEGKWKSKQRIKNISVRGFYFGRSVPDHRSRWSWCQILHLVFVVKLSVRVSQNVVVVPSRTAIQCFFLFFSPPILFFVKTPILMWGLGLQIIWR